MSTPQSKWISLLEHDLMGGELHPPDIFWPPQNPSSQSIDDGTSRENPQNQAVNFRKKRSRDECVGGAGMKACREKLRRDRLNDRFMELSEVLEPDKPLKTDKASILRDAARIVGQLQVEAKQLKNANHELQQTIRELKAEKTELRDEKLSLKSEKERLGTQLKSLNVLPGYFPHLAAVHAAVSARCPQNNPNKVAPPPGLSFSTMSQFMHPETVDTSNDHVLRPPVA